MRWKKKRIWGDPDCEEERNSRRNKDDNVFESKMLEWLKERG